MRAQEVQRQAGVERRIPGGRRVSPLGKDMEAVAAVGVSDLGAGSSFGGGTIVNARESCRQICYLVVQ